ncbi:MAG: hypothetical protein JWO85_934 [Candidatus Eremiobacteraeota bacterium]|nr:hypothetical protein [Candidatus Eremiobacteraeota bacterium]
MVTLTGEGLAQTTSPIPSPSPSPSTAPSTAPRPSATTNPFSFRGYLRVYDFTRQNASTGIGGAGQTNQQTIEPGISVHGDLRLNNSNFTVGGSYLYATPFNGCADPRSHLTPPCGLKRPPAVNPDDTVPGFALNTIYEAYLQYKDERLYAKFGDQLITTPWANAADSRLKPAAFRGADVSYTFPNHFSVDVIDMIEWQSRTNSTFNYNTLLTSFNAGYTGMPLNIFSPGGKGFETPGFQYARVGYAHPSGSFTSNLYDYHFSEIANLAWFDAKYTFVHQKTAPWLAVQGGFEHDVGGSVLGHIDAKVVGAQIGAVVAKNFTLAMGYNFIPRRTETLPIPPGSTCSPNFLVTFQPGVTVPFVLPLNAPQCVNNGNGTATYFYGGVASPYTDTYAADPLFSTSLTQGMVDRRAPGDGFKLSATYASTNKRLILYVSRAYYNYGFTHLQGWQQTYETDADALWYAQPLRSRGPYKGLLLRYRYGARVFENTFTYGGLPLFKYNRAQLEYDF